MENPAADHLTCEVNSDEVEDFTDAGIRWRPGISLANLSCPREDLAAKGETPPNRAIAEHLTSGGPARPRRDGGFGLKGRYASRLGLRH